MIELRGYQKKTIELVRDEIRNGNKRILIVLPTGAGKSHCLGEIALGAVSKDNTVLALMHRRQLVTQLVDFFSQAGVHADIIMSGVESVLKSKVQVGTIQTYHRRLQLERLEDNRFFVQAAVCMIDEAHHALSKTYQTVLSNYEDKIIIGVTATPVLSSGVGMGNFFQAIVSPVSVQDLVDSKYLVPGIYYGPSTPDLSKVKTVMGDYHKTELNKVMNQPKLIGDVVENWLRLADGRKTMVFAVKVNHSKALCHEFQRMGIIAEHLDAHHDDDERNEVLDRFRSGETKVLSNVALYTEGTDIPEIECIVLARPTKSLGFHLQMIGRGARPYPGKKDFLVLDHGGNIERLGFYEDEVEWTLDGKELGYKKKQRKGEKRILTCDMCLFAFTGPRCPQCGHEIKDYGKKVAALDAELVELKGKKPEPTMLEKKQFFGMLEYYRRSKGYAPGWSAHKYKEKFKRWPKGLKDCGPIPPNDEFNRWMKYQFIKYIKAKEKAAA